MPDWMHNRLLVLLIVGPPTCGAILGGAVVHIVRMAFFGAAVTSPDFVISGTFEDTITIEYQACLTGGYAYFVHKNIYVDQPKITSQSAVAAIVEALRGSVSRKIHDGFDAYLRKPRTFIPSLQGRSCLVVGWIPPGSVPKQCEGSEPFSPVGGDQDPQSEVPASWNGRCGRGGLDVTAALAPSEPTKTGSGGAQGASASSWNARTVATIKSALQASQNEIAATIQHTTHPTGRDAKLSEVVFDDRLPGLVIVHISVDWSGLLGGAHVTTVTWEIRKAGHVQASVTSNTAPVPAGHAKELDNYFREELYPSLGLP